MKSCAPSNGRRSSMNRRSALPTGRTSPWRLALLALAVLPSACATHTSYTRPATSCLTLIPRAWLAPTPGAALPLADTQGDWVTFGDAQTGQLDAANAEKLGMVEILTACEKRDAEIVKALQPKKFLGIF
jgi:hypothetical protein